MTLSYQLEYINLQSSVNNLGKWGYFGYSSKGTPVFEWCVVICRIFTSTINKIFIRAPKTMRKIGYRHNLDLAIALHQLCVSRPTRSLRSRPACVTHEKSLTCKLTILALNLKACEILLRIEKDTLKSS